ncbi:hypothetical protein [Psychrobacillus sp. OK032]|uniref:hypothetical protein n=1 Tax=Psychrobacillus sp. OK032 TaxID=1884358 RepID=UPI0008BE7C42|nr:hypothetical protein [Psychrobacillus sp. OK032]SER86260.1 hypothetical protein SAMN05518872_102379 [Psychrobacillus sp. OK032]
MKKKHVPKTKENIIFFPGMVEKLLADGLAFAEVNNHIEAAKCFDQAKEHIELDDTILIVYILSLLETNRQTEAKVICENLLKKRSPLFEQIVELYLTILLDLKAYHEVDSVLNKLLVDKRFTNERKKNFLQLKELSGRLAMEQESFLANDTEIISSVDKDRFAIDNFVKLNLLEQEALLQEAFHIESNEVLTDIIDIAQSKKVSPTVQTLALLLLGANGETTNILIEKFGVKKIVNPVSPPSPNAMERIEFIKRHIYGILDKDPSKLQLTVGLVHSHAYALFPFDWEAYSDEAVAQEYVNFVETLFGNESVQPNELYELIKLLEDSTHIIEDE